MSGSRTSAESSDDQHAEQKRAEHRGKPVDDPEHVLARGVKASTARHGQPEQDVGEDHR